MLRKYSDIYHKRVTLPRSGIFIKEWSSAKEACLFYNPKDLNGVSACCLGKQKTAFGYIWKYK